MVVLLLETLHSDAQALLAASGEVVLAEDPSATSGAPFERVRAILTRGRGRVSATLFERCPRLQVVARAGVGVENIDLECAKRLGVPVLFTPGANTATTAEHTLALLLALTRRIDDMARAVAAGGWDERAHYDGDEAAGKLLGVVGFGAIGRRVASIAAALGLEVAVAAHPGVTTHFRVLPLATLLREADTARGALVDQSALAAALAAGRLGGFAADVLGREPPAPDDPLLKCERVLITPHVASLTETTYRAMCLLAASNVLAVLRGEPPMERCVVR
jgi:phosphoglycerate dehydrogenase-like enzyme